MDDVTESTLTSNLTAAQIVYQASLVFYPCYISLFIFFAIGYISGRFNILPTGRGRSVLSSYIFNIALPAGILYNVTTTSCHLTVLHDFLRSVTIVKAALYFGSILVGIVVTRSRRSNWGVVFLLALCVVHSNDFGIGQPLLTALFENSTNSTSRNYPTYMNDSMMVTFAFFAPLTIFFLELRRNRELSLQWGSSVLYATVRCLFQPVVLSAFIAVIIRCFTDGNAHNTSIAKSYMKWIGTQVLFRLSQTITPIYLIYTGLILVGCIKEFNGAKQIISIITITTLKLLISPLLLKLISSLVVKGTFDSDNFVIMICLYGALPTSPAVVIIASQYSLVTPTLAMIVLSTTLCFAPMSTLSLSMYYVSWCQLFNEETGDIIHGITEGMGFAAAGLAIWVLMVLLFIGKYDTPIYYLLFGQCVALITYSTLSASVRINEVEINTAKATAYGKALAEVLWCMFGCTYLFIVGIAGNQVVHRNLNKIICIMLVAIVMIASSVLALTCFPYTANMSSIKNYIWDFYNVISNWFLVSRILLLAVGMVLGIFPMMARCLPHISDRLNRMRLGIENRGYDPIEETSDVTTNLRNFHNVKMGRSTNRINDIYNGCYISNAEKHKFQIMGFLTLIMTAITCGMTCVSLLQDVTKFSYNSHSKVYLAVVLLYENLWLFNGILLALIFGTPISQIRDRLLWIKQAFLNYMVQGDRLNLPILESLSPDTVLTCQKFIQYHLTACVNAIGNSVEGTFGTIYEDVFTGKDFASWLINVGLAEDRHAAVDYGSKLLMGRVLEHIDKKKNFFDKDYYYKFTRVSELTYIQLDNTNSRTPDNIDNADGFEVNSNDSKNVPDWF